jgi:hypothetical protein
MSTEKSTTGDGMTMTADTSKQPPQRLAAFVAKHPWSCQKAMAERGALAVDVCTTHVPQHLTISVFGSKRLLYSAYARERRIDKSPATGSGSCSATSWGGEGVWDHGEGEPGGRKFCLLDEAAGRTRLVWYSDVGTPTLFRADYDSLDHRTLFFWWENTRHELL